MSDIAAHAMNKEGKILTHQFSSKSVSYYFENSFQEFLQNTSAKHFIFTDSNLSKLYPLLQKDNVFAFQAGEAHKQQSSLDKAIKFLLENDADRNSLIIGVGGGVVTDMTGYLASVFKRGLPLVLMPTSILAMVDASVGGKNGIDVGDYKNMVGTVYQPDKIMFDTNFLQTLPEAEWINGFAEIIKHAAIKDAALFDELEKADLNYYRNNQASLSNLIETNVSIKTNVVLKDEFEKADRRLLNFGHTIGHAIENTYNLQHGHAISVGMVLAAKLSQKLTGFGENDVLRLKSVLEKYGLTTEQQFDLDKIWNYLLADKKRAGADMNFVLLNKIGDAIYRPIPVNELHEHLKAIIS